MAAQPERGRSQQRAERRGHDPGGENGKTHGNAEIEREQRRGISADREQRCMAERHLSDRACDQREAQRQHAEQPGIGQRLQDVELPDDERQGSEGDDRGDDGPARHP